MMNLVSVGKQYGRVIALKDVSVRIDEGDFIIVRGASGSGKSTLIKIIGGITSPGEGKILWKGKDIAKMRGREKVLWQRNNIGFVFQSPELIPYLTAAENVELPMIYNGKKKKEALDRSHRLLDMVGLHARKTHFPAQLSGGEAQRCAIARSLGNMPTLILCDEPTGALDPKGAEKVMRLLKMINRYRKTLIVVTHDPKLEKYGNRIWDLEEGRLAERC